MAGVTQKTCGCGKYVQRFLVWEPMWWCQCQKHCPSKSSWTQPNSKYAKHGLTIGLNDVRYVMFNKPKDIHVLSDALHNVRAFLREMDDWFTPESMRDMYIAGYDESLEGDE